MEDWKEYKLGEIADFRTGKLNSNAAVEHGKYPFFTCSPETLLIDEFAFDQKAILLAGNNAEGNFSIKYYEGKFNAYQRTYIINPINNDVDILFLYYALQLCLQTFKTLSQGTSTKFLTAKILNAFSLKIPSLSNQNRIAGIIKSIDDKIEVNRRINENLEQQAQALFKSWLSNCQDEVTIGDLSINVTDYSKCSYDEVVLVNSSDVTEGRFEHHNLSENKNLKGHFKKRFQKGDILYSQVRPRNRHWAYCTFDAENYLASTQLMVIRNKAGVIPGILLYQYIIGDDVWMEFTNKTETRSGTFPQGNYEEISAIKVKFGADMNNITQSLEHIYSMIYNNDQESRRLAELRDALLPKLMSGEIDVNDIKI